jgi:hypothetical protein
MCKSQFRELSLDLPYILVLTADELHNWLPLRALSEGEGLEENRPLGLSAAQTKAPPFDPQTFPQPGGICEEASQT